MKFSHVVIALSSLSVAGTASAATQINVTNFGYTSGYQTGTVHYSGSPFDNANVNIGAFRLSGTEAVTGKSVSLDTFCVDINHALTVPTTFTVTPLSQLFSATKADAMSKLISNFRATTTLQSAALQLALWEVAFDTQPGSLDSGNFSITGGTSGDARTLANSYLAQLGTLRALPGYQTSLLYSATSQSQIFLSATPEPASWALMLFGFGATGATLRRRGRQQVAVTYA